MRKVSTEQQFQEQISQSGVTIAIFKTTWCKDCHYIDPFMPAVEQAYEGRLTFIELDRDEFPDLCEQLNILGIPSFIAFRNGQEVVRFVSKLRKTREEIEQFLDRAIEVSNALAP
ncbi:MULTISPECIES: thioredoxin family protein [Paenibacillus]|uniref:Thioredoxin n=3 Tax=Paenibacillus TaxID=44249 RepID=A0ABX1XCS7_9BACL|nr:MULTISPECIES: thioredoxin family protein [Paenibacillus]KRE70849.1 thiol-disulfide isomerase [Paenibacillus sp. Soil750]MDR6554955.1 thioredoxin-like negative regulator of GroEL [Paenibacillus qinlingensis]NOU65836.1 thioredoxin [Paenibacillus plantarum]NQX62538.1 thioredoxin family protein [Paenibacillus qinlingensis]CAH1209477.1 Thioredoxin-like protein YtpP [Paenibacillus allorhizoplanae]